MKQYNFTPKDNYFLIKEKSFLFQIFEIFYQRISKENIKETVHKSVYGSDSKGNELNKSLIKICNEAKKTKIAGLE